MLQKKAVNHGDTEKHSYDHHLHSFPFSTKTLADEEHVSEEETVHVELASCALSHL